MIKKINEFHYHKGNNSIAAYNNTFAHLQNISFQFFKNLQTL